MKSTFKRERLVQWVRVCYCIGTALFWTAPITGLRAQDYSYTNINGAITITGYSGPGGNVTIPSAINGLPVVALGDSAFAYRTNLTAVTIPNSVVGIGKSVFQYCDPMTNVVIGANVASIGDFAFTGCHSLLSVALPDSLTNFGNGVFSVCDALSAIAVGPSNPSYSSLDGVLFNKSRTVLVEYPTAKGAEYTFPTGVVGIGDYAFYSGGLTNVFIPDSVTNIGNYAFAYCSGLANARLGNGIISIGALAFEECYLRDVVIPDSAKVIGNYAFQEYYCLSNLVVGSQVAIIGEGAFEDGQMKSVTLPQSVTYIGSCAFCLCPYLTGIYFKGSPPSLAPNPFAGVPTNATVYYLPGMPGWGSTFGGLPTAPWTLPYPVILMNGPGFGAQANGFGSTVSWATNLAVVVEASTNPLNAVWQPLQTNTLINGSFYFTDPQWTNYPGRFYRIRSR